MELDTDRPGMNYKVYDLSSPDPSLCERACKEDPLHCKAWTYVKPGVQGPKARCWLKSGVPPAVKNTSCISGVTQQVPSAAAAKPAQQKVESAIQRSQQSQVESKTFQGLQGQIQSVQLPKETRFKAMAEQKLQQLRATAESKRKADLQHLKVEISSFNADMIRAQMPCDPTSQAPQIKYVYPKEIHPGDPVAIYGCNFGAKDNVSEAVVSAAGAAYGPFWNVSSQSPKSLTLRIDSWTDTVIKASIPYYEYQLDGIPPIQPFVDPIPVKLEVHKGQKYDFQVNKFVPDKVAISSTILLKPCLDIGGIQISANYFTLGQQNDCLSFVDYVPVGAPVNGVQNSTPKILHFSTYLPPNDPQGGICKGKDTVRLQNIHLGNSCTFNTYQFYYQCMSFSPGNPSYTGPCATNWAKLDQDLGDIKGKTTLPDVTVSWQHYKQQGVAYTLLILIEGPKGITW